MKTVILLVLAALATSMPLGRASAAGNSDESHTAKSAQQIKELLMARGGTCKTVSSCEEAVELWCGGYGRADGDGDGIPCENVCGSRSQVEKIKQKIGC